MSQMKGLVTRRTNWPGHSVHVAVYPKNGDKDVGGFNLSVPKDRALPPIGTNLTITIEEENSGGQA